VDEWGGLENR